MKKNDNHPVQKWHFRLQFKKRNYLYKTKLDLTVKPGWAGFIILFLKKIKKKEK